MEKRKVDVYGRITIPKVIRALLEIRTNDELEVELMNDNIIVKKPGSKTIQHIEKQGFTKIEKGTPEWYETTELYAIHCKSCGKTKYGRLFKNTEKLMCKDCGAEINFTGKKRIVVECPDCGETYGLTVQPDIKKVECRKCGRKVKVSI